MGKTFYLWDLCGTVFVDVWDQKKSGLSNYDAYVASLGYDLKTISAREYEAAYERPYREGLFDIQPAPGFEEVLSRTKYNACFTTGTPEQFGWRQQQVWRRFGIDIQKFLPEVFTTFDFAETNMKTKDMYRQLIAQKAKKGFETVVYANDKQECCELFLSAGEKLAGEGLGVAVRAYWIRNDAGGPETLDNRLIAVGDLGQILTQEQSL